MEVVHGPGGFPTEKGPIKITEEVGRPAARVAARSVELEKSEKAPPPPPLPPR